ncbi:MAG: hypothetical protein U0744_15160 [Gemmataceae bacterium]
MNDPLASLEVFERRLDLLDAELWIIGPPEMTGRLAGPKTRYASTIEIPFYLQKIPHPDAPAGGQRVLIPEPSLWSPQMPYLYEAKLDLGPLGKAKFAWGFRRLAWTKDAFRVNGTLAELKAERRSQLTEVDALALREAGINVVVLPLIDAAAWDIADRVGMFLIGEVSDRIDLARSLRWHPSALGWILRAEQSAEALRSPHSITPFLGVDSSGPVPSWAEFTVDAATTSVQHL